MATELTQDGRLLRIDTPLGPKAFLLTDLDGEEGLSRLYEFHLHVVALSSQPVSFGSLLGQPVTAIVELRTGEVRHISGIVCRVSQSGRSVGPEGDQLTGYRLDLVPELWLLTKRTRSRIFQQMTVPDILKKVLTGLDVTYEIQGSFHPRILLPSQE